MPNENKQFNTDQVDWYELDDGGSRAVSFQERVKRLALPTLKIAGLVIVAGALIALLVFIAWKFVFSRDKAVVQNTSLYIESCQSAKDVEGCIASAAPRLAQETGDLDYCEDLEGDEFDNCAVLAALTSEQMSYCNKINDSVLQDTCHDAIVTKTNTGRSYEACEQYRDTELAERCQSTWTREAILQGSCEHSSITPEMCDAGALFASAIEARDPALCDEIEEGDIQETCYEMVGSGDRDLDGLSADEEKYQGTSDEDVDSDDDGLEDYEEIFEYGTDPVNPDSDGDGYLDGEEVIGGYNPLG